ncbi:MAG: sulfate transporter CysZ [Methylococcales bacterium]|nr:sulfate transporter CysZ [Methylococcales bacterium]
MTELLVDKRRSSNPIIAAQSFYQGLRMLAKPEFRRYLIIPVLINLWLFGSLFFIGSYYFEGMIKQFIPEWLDWLSWILWRLFYISLSITFFFTFTLIANLLSAPFYGKLAKKTLLTITDNPHLINEPPLTRVFLGESKRFIYLITRSLPLLLLFIIPGLNLFAPFIWALFGAWGMTLEFLGYPMENEGLVFTEQRQLVNSMRIGALSFGGIVVLGLMIPVLNILVPPAAVIGATIYLQEVKA